MIELRSRTYLPKRQWEVKDCLRPLLLSKWSNLRVVLNANQCTMHLMESVRGLEAN